MSTSISLALSGGAARGIAHIGVIKVLQEEGIQVSAVAGSSIGAIIGALLCRGMSWQDMRDIAQTITWGELVQPAVSPMGLVKTDRLEQFIDELLEGADFQELSTPLTVTAFDITHARPVQLTTGPVASAVRASASIPGIFIPVMRDETLLVDGGVSDNLPVLALDDLVERTVPRVAVDLNPWSEGHSVPGNLLEVTFRTFMALMWNTSQEGRHAADLVIQPDIAHIGYHDLDSREELFAAGENAAQRALESIHTLVHTSKSG